MDKPADFGLTDLQLEIRNLCREIGEKGRIEKDIVLRAGDVVWVPETWY